MTLNSAQLVLRKVLSKKQFDALYNFSCNAFDIYQRISDRYFYMPSYVYKLEGNWTEANRTETVQKVLGHTMTSKHGVQKTYDIAYKALSLSGDFVECGVARGGCSAVMAMVARRESRDRKTWMFDSFEGLPPQTKEDGVQKPIRHKDRQANDLSEGYCLGTLEDVQSWFKELELVANVEMVKGWFQDTLPVYKDKIKEIAVLRLDGDWYESTKYCLENLYKKVVFGGWVIIDDYQLQGCKKAVDEFMNHKKFASGVDKNGRLYIQKL